MAQESIFKKSLEARTKDQETKKADIGLKAKSVPDRISLSLPSDYKAKFENYCKANYISTSAQLRAWIDQFCSD
jgi:cAMP phosphodiesterase